LHAYSIHYQSFFILFFLGYIYSLHSFPTRRSSDLGFVSASAGRTRASPRGRRARRSRLRRPLPASPPRARATCAERSAAREPAPDRKSTRLNSSHLGISYAVFCLKKKNTFHCVALV